MPFQEISISFTMVPPILAVNGKNHLCNNLKYILKNEGQLKSGGDSESPKQARSYV